MIDLLLKVKIPQTKSGDEDRSKGEERSTWSTQAISHTPARCRLAAGQGREGRMGRIVARFRQDTGTQIGWWLNQFHGKR